MLPHEPQGPVAALHAGKVSASLAAPANVPHPRGRRADRKWLGRKDSNPRMPESKSGALTNLATPQRRKPSRTDGALVVRGIRSRASRERRKRMPRERPGDKTLHCRRPRLDRGARFGFGGKGREHAAARSRHPRMRASARANSRAPRRCPEIAQPQPAAGHCGHNPRKRRPFSPTRRFVSIPAPRKSPRSTPRSAARSPRPTAAAATPASGARRCRARARARRRERTERRRPARDRSA